MKYIAGWRDQKKNKQTTNERANEQMLSTIKERDLLAAIRNHSSFFRNAKFAFATRESLDVYVGINDDFLFDGKKEFRFR